jgi:S1-C subfamily serine protease
MNRSACGTRLLISVLIAAFAFGIGGDGGAQTRAVPQSRQDIQLSFAPVVRNAAPAVVNI